VVVSASRMEIPLEILASRVVVPKASLAPGVGQSLPSMVLSVPSGPIPRGGDA